MSTHSNHTTTPTSAKVVAGSLLGGIASAIALVAGPFAGGSEATITGAILIGFAIGWALLAQLSTRFGDGSHRWAAVPAAALGLSGAALVILTPNSQTLDTLGWIWPPLLVALVLWMAARTRRVPAPNRRSWLLYPVFAFMALAAAGCSYENSQAAHAAAPPRSRATDFRRRRTPPEHPLHRHGKSHGRARAGPRRVGLDHRAADRARRRPHHTRLRVRPRRTRPKRRRPRRGCDARPPRPARARARAGALRPGRALARRHVRPELRPPLPVPGRRGRAPGLDAPAQSHTAASDMGPLLDVVPTVARTGIARLLLDPKDGEPAAQARQFCATSSRCPPS